MRLPKREGTAHAPSSSRSLDRNDWPMRPPSRVDQSRGVAADAGAQSAPRRQSSLLAAWALIPFIVNERQVPRNMLIRSNVRYCGDFCLCAEGHTNGRFRHKPAFLMADGNDQSWSRAADFDHHAVKLLSAFMRAEAVARGRPQLQISSEFKGG